MNQNMKPEFLFLADLHAYILTFLPYQDILRCTSVSSNLLVLLCGLVYRAPAIIVLQVCRDLRQTYLSSSELQYLVELGGQQLLPVYLSFDSHEALISERLQLLRDKAQAWLKFDTQPVETVDVSDKYIVGRTVVSNGHFGVVYGNRYPAFAKISPILPEPSQQAQAVDRGWHRETLFSVPNARNIEMYMDPTQNLLATVYHVIDGSDIYIDLLPLDRDGAHPQAAGPTLFMSPGLLTGRRQNTRWKADEWKLEGLGRYIALRHSLALHHPNRVLWWLQIWDWQHSTTSDSVLSDTLLGVATTVSIDHCFLGTSRLLIIVGINLRVYSIEDMSQAPHLLVCFLLPAPIQCANFFPAGSKDDGAHRSLPGMRRTMWKSDPTHRVLSLSTYPFFHFVVSTRIFFEPDFINEAATTIPWTHWGPLNVRIFQRYWEFMNAGDGSRVLRVGRAIDATDDDLVEYSLHMMDFSPLAIKHRRGLGRLVSEPSTIDLDGVLVTTSLPYVEVASNKKSISKNEMTRSSIDEGRIYAFHIYAHSIEVIKIWEGV